MFKTVDYEDEPLNQEAFNDEQVEEVTEEVTEDVAEETTEEVYGETLQETRPELDEDLVKEYLKSKYGAEFDSIDELVKSKDKTSDRKIPEDVEKYLDYKEKTGRSYSDFMETQKEWDKEDPNYVLKKYLSEKNPYLDAEEVNEEFEEKYVFDVDYDDEKDIKTKKREFKKTLSEALDYFNGQKDQYAVARFDESVIPEPYKVAKATLDNFNAQQEESQKAQAKQQENFVNLTDKLFSDDFKGFDFNVAGNKMTYNVPDVVQVKESQKNIMNLIGKFVDAETGMLKDASGHHKGLYAYANADKLAEHFYELGKSDAIKSDISNSKNIDMGQKEVGSTSNSSPKMFKLL
jgi:hypothetical protein